MLHVGYGRCVVLPTCRSGGARWAGWGARFPRINEGGRIATPSKISDSRNYAERRLLPMGYTRCNDRKYLQVLYNEAI